MSAKSLEPSRPALREASRHRVPRFAGEQRYVNAPFLDCPVEVTVGALGKKWTLRILGHVAVYGHDRFNTLLSALPGIAPKVLANKLKELEKAGLLVRAPDGASPNRVRWTLTERGRDAVSIVIVMIGFSSKHYPELLYDDAKPRTLPEILDDEGLSVIRNLV